MKIVIELTDADFRNAVETQVGKAVAAFTEQAIREKVDGIVALKLDRLGKVDIEARIDVVAKQMINEVLGSANDYTRKNVIRTFLADAAEKAIKGSK